jgi:serine/threonine protein kinase
MEDDPRFLAFVHAIAEGVEVDWDEVESSAANESMRVALLELRIISGIADFHQEAPSFRRDTPAESLAPPLAEPRQQWGPLRLIELVGHGSFGDVWRAHDERLDREVALKLLRDPASEPHAQSSRVIQEARLLARVSHHNVVTVHGAEQIEGTLGLWTEFIHGRSLSRILKDHGPFSPQEATSIALDLCRALSAVHRAGLLHRDIKAQNVMREAGGRVVLMDFGSGSLIGSEANGPAGTPLYIAPELLLGQPPSVQSDIYSLAVLVYHLVTGSYPVLARTLDEIRDAHRSGQRTLLRDARPDLPSKFVNVIERGLATNPDERYQSAGAFEAALSSIAGFGATVESSRSRPLLAIAVGTAAIVVVVLGLNVGEWRDRLFEVIRRPPGDGVRPAALGSSTLVRKLPFSFDYTTLGRPSFDGRFLSFSAPDGNLAIADLTTGATRPITVKNESPEQAGESVVSPDGCRIAYTWFALDGAAELRLIHADGTSPHVLLRDEAVTQPSPVEWSRDGTQILALLGRVDGTNEIALIGAEDGQVRVLKSMRWLAPHYMSLSPDGRYVVFDLPERTNAVSRDIYLVATDGGGEVTLVQHPANDVFPAWTPEGHGVFFASDRSGSMDIWMLPLEEGRPAGSPDLVKRDIGRIYPLGVTATGDYYFQVQERIVDVYTADLDPVSGVVSGQPKPISSRFVGQNISPEWSPDGVSVAYVSMRGLVPNDRNSRMLTIANLATGEQRDLIPDLSFFIRPRWSPDGRRVLVRGRDFKNRWGVHVIDVQSGGVSPVVLPQSGEGDGVIGDFEWSSDGRAILYEKAQQGIVSRDLVSGVEKRLFDYRSDSITRLHVGGGFQVSPEGGSIGLSGNAPASSGGRGTTVLKVKSLNGASVELLRAERPEWITLAGWSHDSRALLFRRSPGQEPTALWRIPVTGGTPQDLGLNLPALRDVRVRPDGRRLAFTAGFGDTEIWVMQRFLPGTSQRASQ